MAVTVRRQSCELVSTLALSTEHSRPVRFSARVYANVAIRSISGVEYDSVSRARLPASVQRFIRKRRPRGVNRRAAQWKFHELEFVTELLSRLPQDACRRPRHFRADSVSCEQNNLLLHNNPRADRKPAPPQAL